MSISDIDKHIVRQSVLTAISCTCLLFSGFAHSQDGANGEEELEEVVVTAQNVVFDIMMDAFGW